MKCTTCGATEGLSPYGSGYWLCQRCGALSLTGSVDCADVAPMNHDDIAVKMAEDRVKKAEDAIEAAHRQALCQMAMDENIREISRSALLQAGGEAPKLDDCLGEAKATICGERQDQYGNPEDSFALVAKYWSTYLIEVQKKVLIAHGFDPAEYKLVDLLTSLDVDHMMILFKVARCQGQKLKRDSYVDICGYAAIAADRLMGER